MAAAACPATKSSSPGRPIARKIHRPTPNGKRSTATATASSNRSIRSDEKGWQPQPARRPNHHPPAARSRERSIGLRPMGKGVRRLQRHPRTGLSDRMKKDGSRSLPGDQIIIPRPPDREKDPSAYAQWEKEYGDCNGILEQVYQIG